MQVNSKLVSLDTALSSLSKTQDKEVIKWKQILQHNKSSMVMKLLVLKRKNYFFQVFSLTMMANHHVVYLVRDIKPPNNQYCFPQFRPEIFSVLAVEK